MSFRRLLFVFGLALLGGAFVWWLLPRPADLSPATPSPAAPAASAVSAAPTAPAVPAAPSLPAAPVPSAGAKDRPLFVDASPTISVAAALNDPGSTITRDLTLLNDLLSDWRLNFPNAGNPWGENAEITAALTGDNALGLRLIPRTHPAINAAGELVDRWGTPFLFHALAGDRMEVRSAGADTKFGTPDDARFTPPPPPGGGPLL
jgi:hypothetical protein